MMISGSFALLRHARERTKRLRAVLLPIASRRNVVKKILPVFLLLFVCALAGASRAQDRPARATLLFAGDLMAHSPQLAVARRKKGYDFAPSFAAVKPIVSAADLAVAKGLKTVTLKVSPMLGAYLTRGYFDSYLKKWKRKYKIRIGLEEVTKFSVLQNEIYNEKGERLD